MLTFPRKIDCLMPLNPVAESATPRLRIIASAVMLFGSGLALAQQTISSSTTSTVTATGGDIVVNSGVTVGSSSGSATPIYVDNVNVGNLTNNGSLLTSTSNGSALYFNSTAPLAEITNNAVMTSKSGIQLHSAASIVNNNSMLGTDRGITVYASATGSSITNNGYLNAFVQSYAGISNQSGSILTSVTNAQNAIISGLVPIENNGTITTFTNRGTIWSRHWVSVSAIGGSGSITNLINYGTLTPAGSAAAVGNTVVNLANAQGGNTPLTIDNQPTNYAIIIDSPTSYGKLSVLNALAPMNFDVYAGSSITSGYYYSSVLTGVTAANLANTSGTYSSTAWNLSLASGSNNIWNLCFGGGSCSFTLSSNILPGQTYQSSALGTSVNRSFDGGTLQMSSASTVAGNFSITANGGAIDQNGYASTFSGNFSDASLGAVGKLTIMNSGTAGQGSLTLSGNNTHTGGIEVDAGAMLVINSASALGSGTLALVGSATIPATLGTTQTMTIANAITVAGDPIFNVASGTVLTVSSAIADGGIPGDVEVQGGGTLQLSAANTYTGPTLIDSGSTLALSGAGSITTSSGLTNNGYLDLRNANATTVALGGSYTQSSTGTLKMAASAPGAFQKLTVGGAATLSGALDLTAAAGNYAMGRYTLIDATGGRAGTFSTFSNNLSSVTRLGYVLGYDVNQVYLFLTPNTDDALQDIRQNAVGLRSLINNQASALQAGLTYDCTVFDENNVCVSAGGRYTYSGESSIANQGGLLILGYRPTANSRFGVFADQSLTNNGPSSIAQSKNTPTLGLFGNWALNKDGNGLNIHASAVFSSSDLTISRTASATTEAGQGKTSFDGQAYELRANYVEPVTNNLTVTPYIGLRYTRIANGPYTEKVSSQVAYPVSYNGMAQDAFSVIAGANLSLLVMDKLTATAGLGVQQNLSYRMGNYAGTTDIPGLANFSVSMAGKTETLGTASVGSYYDISKKERIAVNALWQEQPSYHKGTTSVLATWAMGF